MKKLSSLLLKAYLGPFIATFLIAMLFLVMQFLWRYIDDLMGKGLDFLTVAEFLFYVCFNLVPMALPLAILLSSLMTFGALGESNELTALKSTGVSLFRIMRPVTFFIVLISIGAFFFGNYAWPWSNLKWKTLYYEIRESKPAFLIPEKVFYNDIPNFSIRIDKKSKEGKSFSNVVIYDYSPPNEYRKRDVKASEGEILQSKNADFMLLRLNDGVIYEEMTNSKMRGAKFPFRTTVFEQAQLKFDISGFKLTRGNEDLFKDSYEMLNIFQLNNVTDSLKKTLGDRRADYLENITQKHFALRPKMRSDRVNDSIRAKTISPNMYSQTATATNIANNTPANNKYKNAIDLCHSAIQTLESCVGEMTMRLDALNRYNIEWHRKFTLPLACLIIFFIGAPLGSIVKKGGLGTPLVISVLLFILYHILTITGEKMAKSGTLDAFSGMWFSAFILAPIGILLTWLAAKESSLVSVQTYFAPFARILRFKKKKNIAS